MRVVTLGALGEAADPLVEETSEVTIVDGNGVQVTESQLAGLRAYLYGGTLLMAGFLGYTAYKKMGA